MDSLGASYKVVDFNEEKDGLALRTELAQITGRTSVPSVWIGGEFVGGYNDGGLGGVATLYKSGRLRSMLDAAKGT